jgi:hypothetical protein
MSTFGELLCFYCSNTIWVHLSVPKALQHYLTEPNQRISRLPEMEITSVIQAVPEFNTDYVYAGPAYFIVDYAGPVHFDRVHTGLANAGPARPK